MSRTDTLFFRVYGWNEDNEIVDINPEYEGLSKDKAERVRIYKKYIEEGKKERRDEERFFKDGVYGDKEFIDELKTRGLKSVWSHAGQPKKKGRKEDGNK